MPIFGSTTRRHHHSTGTPVTHHRRRHFWQRRDRDRVAGGYKAALANPNTTRQGRKHAKHELHAMGKSAHVPFMTKVKRTLGIRSSPRRKRAAY
ncbi:hypothetical protein C8J56DRAFT_867667 [Mycena floridula]|nr:hypothetical protein C8J56DRAFT_867667 [Mycena floridula]